LGTYFLSRELNSPRPMLAALVALFTPVFLLCASTVMYDVIMLALWVWAVWAWAAGMRRERAGLLWLAAGLAPLAALTKYGGVAASREALAHPPRRRRTSAGRRSQPAVPVARARRDFPRILGAARGLRSRRVGGARQRVRPRVACARCRHAPDRPMAPGHLRV